MKKIVVALDFSDQTSEILAHAQTFAQIFQSKLWLIHVADPEPEFIGMSTGPQDQRDRLAEIYKNEHHHIQEEAKLLRDQGFETVGLLVQGQTVPALLKEAEKLGADLIIVGSHGRSGLQKFLLGSVSQEILPKAPCPVLVIPPKEELAQ
ncbi:universal stress protein [Roseofilum reptotaenium CS-1145]|uniref:Universal stress protein n=1 Tax=Roseofilum reptotaenium AO1-A TaxID=1925591 RepID=A0A1L9QP96_9CYAN|nr:universal stress protein [Roseofilum reptotaenium]MDB9516419.1 universal stress protein [Roseofilum reptotaenium CS-1145]OJJ24417.1 universal stress protein [Roseofilum reptotaenium AO1-A]